MRNRIFNFIIDGRLITVKGKSVKEAKRHAQQIARSMKTEENMGNQSAIWLVAFSIFPDKQASQR